MQHHVLILKDRANNIRENDQQKECNVLNLNGNYESRALCIRINKLYRLTNTNTRRNKWELMALITFTSITMKI